jgi:hypothetical protein
MFVLIECADGTKRVRKKAAIKDVYLCSVTLKTMISFYGKDLCPLKSKLNVEDFFTYHELK